MHHDIAVGCGAEEMKIVHEVISFQAPWVRGKITLKNWKRAIAFKKHLKKKQLMDSTINGHALYE